VTDIEALAIRNLVFEGCGAKGLAFVGAIQALAERQILPGVERVAGTSSGAILSALLAVGADLTTLQAMVEDETLADRLGGLPVLSDVLDSPFSFGLHSGDAIEEWVDDQIERVTRQLLGEGRGGLTFEELADLADRTPGVFRRLYVVSTNLSKNRAQVFCEHTTPTVPIARAVRLSATLPGIVQATEFEGDLHIDGGLTWNYPFQLFAGEQRAPLAPSVARTVLARCPPEQTLGFVSLSRVQLGIDDGAPPAVRVDSVVDYVNAVFLLVGMSSTGAHLSSVAADRTVFVDCGSVSPVDFQLSARMRRDLVERGRQSTEAWLDA